MRQIKVVIVTALIFGLMACAAPLPQVVKLMPPVDLLQDCAVPSYTINTNGELANGILLERNALALCNADKQALRAWADSNN